MRVLTAVCLTIAFFASALPGITQTAASLRGIQYQYSREPGQDAIVIGLPAGLKDQGGFIIGNVSVQQPHAVSMFQKGDRRLWLFERILARQTSQSSQGITNRQTIQVLDMIESSRDVYPGVDCELNGKSDPELFAWIKDSSEQSEWITQFDQVLRANRKTQKLEIVNPKGIRCPNPDWGI